MRIVIEGIDGAGKTSLAKRLLTNHRTSLMYIHYPVNIDFSLEGIKFHQAVKQDMIDHQAPDNCIIDRYWQSSYAYGMPSYMLKDLKQAINLDTYNIFLDVSPVNAYQRCMDNKGKTSRWDIMSIQERAKLRERYLELDCWHCIIDANQSFDSVLHSYFNSFRV